MKNTIAPFFILVLNALEHEVLGIAGNWKVDLLIGSVGSLSVSGFSNVFFFRAFIFCLYFVSHNSPMISETSR